MKSDRKWLSIYTYQICANSDRDPLQQPSKIEQPNSLFLKISKNKIVIRYMKELKSFIDLTESFSFIGTERKIKKKLKNRKKPWQMQ